MTLADPGAPSGDAHHALTAHEVLLILGSDPERGLSDDEARRRFNRFGPNRLPSVSGGGWLLRVARQFHNPLIYVLVVAGLVTLSLGERSDEDLKAWREAGADRYLLRFETSDPVLYRRIHPNLPGVLSDRFAQLNRMRDMGYEIGTGVMVGIPGQTWDTLASDILRFRDFDMDMIGVGPFLPSPRTPLGGPQAAVFAAAPEDQVPNDELTTLKAVALTRLVCPDANIPSTTALATLDSARGRELALMRGANVVMPNVTPVAYRARYEIYPGKACIHETAAACQGCLAGRIHSIGRRIGKGPGGRFTSSRKTAQVSDHHH